MTVKNGWNPQKVTVKDEKCPIEAQKVTDSDEKCPIEDSKVSDSRKHVPVKLSIESYTKAYLGKGYNVPTVHNLKAIYDDIELNQVFGSVYLMKILECSDRAARRLLAKLREMDVVIAVTGRGKGIYRFKYESEV